MPETPPPSRPYRARAVATLARPLQDFLRTEAAGGAVLLAATGAALVWANVAATSYADVWGRHLELFGIEETLQAWVNNALMVLFFYVAGLEIKRELFEGELADARRAALPIAGAVGGLAVPALIFYAFNGWTIPMSTDIAFTVGVVALAGSGVPQSLKIFLLALAIVDDIGAIVVIAVFYSGGIEAGWLAVAAGAIGVAFAVGARRPQWAIALVPIGAIAWYATYQSGVHPTVAGVALGLCTPLVVPATDGREERRTLDNVEHVLHPWASFLVLPVFALANAGVTLGAGAAADALRSPVAAGIVFGLVVGKPAGVITATWLSTRLRLAALPDGVGWGGIGAAGVVAGICFTVPLFVIALTFDDPAQAAEAKIAVLFASVVAGSLGFVLLRLVFRRAPVPVEDVR